MRTRFGAPTGELTGLCTHNDFRTRIHRRGTGHGARRASPSRSIWTLESTTYAPRTDESASPVPRRKTSSPSRMLLTAARSDTGVAERVAPRRARRQDRDHRVRSGGCPGVEAGVAHDVPVSDELWLEFCEGVGELSKGTKPGASFPGQGSVGCRRRCGGSESCRTEAVSSRYCPPEERRFRGSGRKTYRLQADQHPLRRRSACRGRARWWARCVSAHGDRLSHVGGILGSPAVMDDGGRGTEAGGGRGRGRVR